MTSSNVKFGMLAAMYPPAADALESYRRADALGWDFIDVPDQLQATHPSGMLVPPVPANDLAAPTSFFSEAFFGSMEMSVAAAVLTENVDILLGVIDPLRRSPALMAQEMATLQHLSGGRMTFAIGVGEDKQFVPYGETRSKPFGHLEEALHTWLALWDSSGEPIDRDSEFFPLRGAVFPLPLPDSGRPQLLMTGGGDRIKRLAGEVADGWFTFLPGGSANDTEALAALIGEIKDIAKAAGRDPEALRFNSQILMVLAEDDDTAWELARHPNNGWLSIIATSMTSGDTWEKLGYKHPLGDFVWVEDVSQTVVDKAKAEELAPGIPDEITDFTLVTGGPERVANRIQGFVDAGINEITFLNCAVTADPEYGARWNELASDVIKRLGGRGLNLPSAQEAA